jgi:hypothetical protein
VPYKHAAKSESKALPRFTVDWCTAARSLTTLRPGNVASSEEWITPVNEASIFFVLIS